jgi:DNA-binding IclR family transcriptional regulator
MAMAMVNQLVRIQSRGFAMDNGALGEGIASVAAPIFGGGGKLQGALCVVGPEFRLSQEFIENQILSQLLDTCGIISSKLGWHSSYIPRTQA